MPAPLSPEELAAARGPPAAPWLFATTSRILAVLAVTSLIAGGMSGVYVRMVPDDRMWGGGECGEAEKECERRHGYKMGREETGEAAALKIRVLADKYEKEKEARREWEARARVAEARFATVDTTLQRVITEARSGEDGAAATASKPRSLVDWLRGQ
jgi:hypothetical protein